MDLLLPINMAISSFCHPPVAMFYLGTVKVGLTFIVQEVPNLTQTHEYAFHFSVIMSFECRKQLFQLPWQPKCFNFKILLYGCETWPVRVADERMLEVVDNDSILRILRVRRKDCLPSAELCRRLHLTSIPALFVQRRLRWFGHGARRPDGELIKDLLLPTPPRTWRGRIGC